MPGIAPSVAQPREQKAPVVAPEGRGRKAVKREAQARAKGKDRAAAEPQVDLQAEKERARVRVWPAHWLCSTAFH